MKTNEPELFYRIITASIEASKTVFGTEWNCPQLEEGE